MRHDSWQAALQQPGMSLLSEACCLSNEPPLKRLGNQHFLGFSCCTCREEVQPSP